MAQQKGFKRAIKVALRAKRKKMQAREAEFKRWERADQLANAPAAAAADKK